MKTIRKLISLFLLLSLTFTILASCAKEKSTEFVFEFVLEMPSEMLQAKFEKEYVKYMNYDSKDRPYVSIEYWYGSFGDVAFLTPHIGDNILPDMICNDQVAGYNFVYPNTNAIIVWTNGKFLSMNEAYDKKIITEEMVSTIHEIHTKKLYIEVQNI